MDYGRDVPTEMSALGSHENVKIRVFGLPGFREAPHGCKGVEVELHNLRPTTQKNKLARPLARQLKPQQGHTEAINVIAIIIRLRASHLGAGRPAAFASSVHCVTSACPFERVLHASTTAAVAG